MKQFESQIADLNAELEKSQRNLSDMVNNKTKFEREAAELSQQLEEAEHNVGSFSKEKSRLAQQLEEARSALEDETRVRFSSFNRIFKKNGFKGMSCTHQIYICIDCNLSSCQVKLQLFYKHKLLLIPLIL